ncbi:DnaJ-domain-containing protein [Clavulina sp. PMI_390]|nr:DnaJ-domain-containing protein [Clavulina sp. PMI_390]
MAALSSSASAVLRFVGWSFLPSALADGAIRSYHRILKPGSPVPQRGTPSYATAYRIAFTTLAAIYLLYTLVAAVTSLQPNYYSILGVPRDADEQALKAAFRQFARKNHPDRPGIGAAGAGRFREVRDAYEMLKNPVKRFAYERFGPEIISWKDCTTVKEYMRRGLSASSGFPIGTVIVLGLMSVLGQSSSSSFVSECSHHPELAQFTNSLPL